MSKKYYVGQNGKTVCLDGKIFADCDLGNNFTNTDKERQAIAIRIVNCLNACSDLLDVSAVKDVWNFASLTVEQVEANTNATVISGSELHCVLRQTLVKGRGPKWKERIE